MFIHTPTLVALAGVLATSLVYYVVRTLSNPVAKLPGSQISKWTELPWWSTFLRHNRISHQLKAHEKYGPFVRLAPNEVAVSDPETIKSIFKFSSGYLKSKWYLEQTGAKDGDNIFTSISPHIHSQRRRLLGQTMSESHIHSTLEPTIRSLSELFTKRLRGAAATAGDGSFDLLRWSFYYSTDVIGELTFGESFNMLALGEENEYINDIRSAAKIGAISSAFPRLAKLYLSLPFSGVVSILESRRRTVSHALASIARYNSLLSKDPARVKPTLFTKVFKATDDGAMTDGQLAAEARAYLVAGTDTTAYAFTYLIFFLSQHPDLQASVAASIAALPSGYTSADVKQIPLLERCISETLRFRAPVSASLPRVVPASGLRTPTGHFLPAGTVLHPQVRALQRNPAIFPDPDSWVPARWEQPTPEMKDAILAWGGGGHVCLGRNLALIELHLAVADFYRAFPKGVALAQGAGADPARGVKGMSVEEMDQTELFLAGPKGGRCLLKPL